MQHLAGECAGIRGQDGLPVVAVGDHEARIGPGCALAFEPDAPALIAALGRRHALVEADARVEAELRRVGPQIALRLGAAQIMRPFLGKLEIRVAREPLRGIEEGRAIDDVGAVGIPNTADIGERLETVERNAPLGESLGYRQAAGPRADDTETLHLPSPLALYPPRCSRANLSIPAT